MTDLVVLEVDGDRALGAVRHTADGPVARPRLPARAHDAFDALVIGHPGSLLAWRDRRLGDMSPVERWPDLLRHELEVRHGAHLHVGDPVRSSVGAAHFTSPFVAELSVDHPVGTWFLSPLAGIGFTDTLARGGRIGGRHTFTVAMAVLGHRLAARGALLWSEPALGSPPSERAVPTLSDHDAALVVRHTTRRAFLSLWLLARVHGRRLPLIAALRAAATPAMAPPAEQRRAAPVVPVTGDVDVDVVIPTLGRRPQLEEALAALAAQRCRPRRVVVVDQILPGDPDPGPCAAHPPLDVHRIVLDRSGACHARNVGLAATSSPWILLVDDDVRFGPDYLGHLVAVASDLHVDAVVAGHDEPTEGPTAAAMWHHFGAGESLVARTWFDAVGGFDRRLDGGYGEDYEWGMRARAAGAMVVRARGHLLRHLHASEGGFRRPFPHPWHRTGEEPVPSPTVTLSHRLWETEAMRVGRTWHYWLRATARDRGRHWLRRRRRWHASLRWADALRVAMTPEEATRLGP